MRKRKNMLVQNTVAVAAPPASILRNITFNLKGAKLRYEDLEGVQHMVVPMVMLTEGVHSGSQGPILYERKDLGAFSSVWNHKPIVVYHPVINGNGVSACDPVILNNSRIGLILASEENDGKLRAEAWLNPARVKKVDNRILEKLEKGEMVELSTGLYCDTDDTPGEFNGKPYKSIARNYRPDHLAILPDQIGACSIADGAGLLRNAVSFSQTRELLGTALRDMGGDYAYVEDVFPKFCIYCKNGKLYRQNYTATDTQAALVGQAEEVVRVVQYRSTDGTVIANQEMYPVNKMQMIALLLANAAWTPADKPWLESQTEERLKQLTANLKAEEKAKAPETPATVPPVSSPAPVVVGNTAPPVVPTVADYINGAPPAIRSMLANGLRAHEAAKQALIERITANKANTFTPAQLSAMEIDQLQSIAAFCVPTEVPVGNYAGLADIFARNTSPALPGSQQKITETVLDLPVMNFGAAR